jgi:hypothetical protein
MRDFALISLIVTLRGRLRDRVSDLGGCAQLSQIVQLKNRHDLPEKMAATL